MKVILQGQTNGDVLLKTGGTMTGGLILNGDPTENLQAATKQYVDNNIIGISFWGNEDDDANAEWWATLKSWLSTSTEEQRSKCLGKTKSVTLAEEVLGTTTHLVQCIGYDCDGIGTLTFQTKGVLNTATIFCSLDEFYVFGEQALWYDGTNNSTVRTQCINYYNAFPGKDSIKTVSKKYCSIQSSPHGSQTSDQVYDETVFLPSEIEMGLNSLSVATDEFCTENTEGISYQLYTSNASRMKYNSNGNAYEYWERSRDYLNPDNVCIVEWNGTASNYCFTWYEDFYDVYLAPAFAIG